eukprot:TRINITY_DN54740_c0_g1_i1.p1 TRINITY_DN54740_c0_g1~~TRINITY_DN54740_c0_g1_i1.p1  ORF type:complete len:728 (-),score=49.32 TRINITY_DN54740_c0_g1_i1:1399-3582(-)
MAEENEVTSLLRKLRISQTYIDRFIEQEICDIDTLKYLDQKDIEHLIPKLGPRVSLKRWLEANGGLVDQQQAASGGWGTTPTGDTPPAVPPVYNNNNHTYDTPPPAAGGWGDTDSEPGDAAWNTNQPECMRPPQPREMPPGTPWDAPSPGPPRVTPGGPGPPQPGGRGGYGGYYNRADPHGGRPPPRRDRNDYDERFRKLGMRPTAQAHGRAGFSSRQEPAPTALFQRSAPVGPDYDAYVLKVQSKIYGRDPPKAQPQFKDWLAAPPALHKNITAAGYKVPTLIQAHAFPAVIAGRDMICCSQTGSGKTAAYLLPVLTLLDRTKKQDQRPRMRMPLVLVLVPTRELAQQVYDETRKFSYEMDIAPVLLIGGANPRDQQNRLQNGVDVVIATTGRLLEFCWKRRINLSKLKWLIIDEADRMLDAHGYPFVQEVVEKTGMPPKTKRQVIIFSATLPDQVIKLGLNLLSNEIMIVCGELLGTNQWVDQDIMQVDDEDNRMQCLATKLKQAGSERVLVFCNDPKTVDAVHHRLLHDFGIQNVKIHSELPQCQRDEAIHGFKDCRIQYLISSDLLSRGIDFPNLQYVLLYQLPRTIQQYLHRIGRTGRMGKRGFATSFFHRQYDRGIQNQLADFMEECKKRTGAAVPDCVKQTPEYDPKDLRGGAQWDNLTDSSVGETDSEGSGMEPSFRDTPILSLPTAVHSNTTYFNQWADEEGTGPQTVQNDRQHGGWG